MAASRVAVVVLAWCAALDHVCAVAMNLSTISDACEHECTECDGTQTHKWYTQDAFGNCTKRSSAKFKFFGVAHHCRIPGSDHRSVEIRDPRSCFGILEGRNAADGVTLSFNGQGPDGKVVENGTIGCNFVHDSPKVFGLTRLHDDVCFGQVFLPMAIGSQMGAVLFGIVLAALSSYFARKPHTGFIAKFEDDGEKAQAVFGPGAKAVATKTIIDKNKPHARHYVLLYRFFQVVANIWLPMALLWVVSPIIMIPLYVLLYAVPAFMQQGVKLFLQPQYLISPARCSFYGIDNHQNRAWGQLLYSMLRPFLLLAAIQVVARIAVHYGRAHGFDDTEIGHWVINAAGFWRLSLETDPGTVVFVFTAGTTVIGTVLHIILTIPVVVRGILGTDGKDNLMSLEPNPDLFDEIQMLRNTISDAAQADEEDDKDRVDALGVETLSAWNVRFAVLCAIVDLGAYLYKIFSFSTTSQYFLATITTLSLVEALTALLIGGHVQVGYKAYKQAVVTGVPDVHFLACVQWDDGLAGIPCLFMTVYGLPLLVNASPVSSLSSIIFLMTGTRALASYLQDVIDADMFASGKMSFGDEAQMANWRSLLGGGDDSEEESAGEE